eukprot:TRINITY_DN2592_c0_g1_i1.p1 TRINITY_DN2592_c0_g1~~TRINITY_DN2592_c0_g1_i1.p1  ORF type:complete len:215 (+),score=-2.64 TRINITY_DN2592_c0_g1_i1:1048-1692(+)
MLLSTLQTLSISKQKTKTNKQLSKQIFYIQQPTEIFHKYHLRMCNKFYKYYQQNNQKNSLQTLCQAQKTQFRSSNFRHQLLIQKYTQNKTYSGKTIQSSIKRAFYIILKISITIYTKRKQTIPPLKKAISKKILQEKVWFFNTNKKQKLIQTLNWQNRKKQQNLQSQTILFHSKGSETTNLKQFKTITHQHKQTLLFTVVKLFYKLIGTTEIFL